MKNAILPVADKLAKVCGLLASTHDGERSAAAYRASEILREVGCTWRELVEGAARGAGQEQPALRPRAEENVEFPVEWHAAVQVCRQVAGQVTDWERGFVDTIANRQSISAKQKVILAQCYAKTRRTGR